MKWAECPFNASVGFHGHYSLTSASCVTDYLSRIITSHSAHACDGQPLRLHCPRHSTISIQSAFYGSGGARLCGADPPPGAHNHSCSAFTALQVHFYVYGIYGTFHSRRVSCVRVGVVFTGLCLIYWSVFLPICVLVL